MQNIIFWLISFEKENPWLEGSKDVESFLTRDELLQYQSFRFKKRQNEWLHGRWACKYLFRHSQDDSSSVSDLQVQIKNEAQGAPFMQSFPDGSRLPVTISISHRDQIAFCGLSDNPGIDIGVDIEKIESRSEAFMKDYFTNNEYTFGQSKKNPDEKDLWFTLCWSLKEAGLKALGKGLRLDTRCIEVNENDEINLKLTNEVFKWRKIRIKWLDDSHSTRWLSYWAIKDGYVYTIAAAFHTTGFDPALVQVKTPFQE